MSLEYEAQQAQDELAKFNSQFEVYNKNYTNSGDVTKNNTFFDVLTVANLAYDINKKANWDSTVGVQIEVEVKAPTNKIWGIYTAEGADKLEKNYFFKKGNITPNKADWKYMYDNDFVQKNASLKDNSEKYKYYFLCKSIEYSDTTGKVNYMKFEAKENP